MRYYTEVTRVDIDTGEDITENTNINSEYEKKATATKYEKIDENSIKKKLIIQYKHNGQLKLI